MLSAGQSDIEGKENWIVIKKKKKENIIIHYIER